MHRPAEVKMILGASLGVPSEKDTNNNLPLTCLTQAVANARNGCSAQRIEVLALVDEVAQSGGVVALPEQL